MPRVLAFLICTLLCAQQPGSDLAKVNPTDPAAAGEPDVEFICPMDKDVRSKAPGNCSRCGMKLVAGLPDPHEYPVHLTTLPKVPKPGENLKMSFRVEDPDTSKTVKDFEIVHEKLFHLFVVSQDLGFFVHTHPEIQPDGTFVLDGLRLPKAGLYRVLSDIYPKGGTPQLITNTLMVPGTGFKLAPAKLEADLKPQHSENVDVELVTEPAQPIVGEKTLMFFRLKPNDGIEPYLGAMGHMMAASSDLIDMIHTHPFLVYDPREGDYKQIQFNVIFPRTGVYRVWVQFQRKGVVNTVAFNVPVSELK
jgi:hypothetical protein